MNKILLTILTFLVFSCKDKDYGNEQKIFDRIEFVYKLKQTVDDKTWKTFNDKEYDLPLVYFTDSSSYIANPTEKFLKTFKADLVFETRQIKVYKTKNRVDRIPFHMETEMTLGDSTDEFNYHSPFMMCSSYEEVHKTIPDVLSTDEWTTMIMHEYFHGFQYKHNSFVDYFEKNIAQIPEDSLRSIYQNNLWFKNYIDKENQLLLKAIDEKDTLKTKKFIAEFSKLRAERRKIFFKKYNFDISKYEKCFETMEGTARYIEYSLYKDFSTQRPDYKLLKSDSSFKSFKKFRNYDLDNDKWLYQTEKTSYFYAIGFNMARLLDKLKIEYKSKLFKQGQLTLEDILMDKQNGR